jgi:hypothetical protein
VTRPPDAGGLPFLQRDLASDHRNRSLLGVTYLSGYECVCRLKALPEQARRAFDRMGIGCTIVSALAAVLVFCEMAIRSNVKIEATSSSNEPGKSGRSNFQIRTRPRNQNSTERPIPDNAVWLITVPAAKFNSPHKGLNPASSPREILAAFAIIISMIAFARFLLFGERR